MNDQQARLVKAAYSELLDYLKNLPTTASVMPGTLDVNINALVDELEKLLPGEDLDRFKIKAKRFSSFGALVMTDDVRMKLVGIVSRIRSRYLADEPNPFAAIPQQVINFIQSQYQAQAQNVNVLQVVEQFSKTADEKIRTVKDENESRFWRKLKEGLGNVKTIADIIALAIKIAMALGLDRLPFKG